LTLQLLETLVLRGVAALAGHVHHETDLPLVLGEIPGLAVQRFRFQVVEGLRLLSCDDGRDGGSEKNGEGELRHNHSCGRDYRLVLPRLGPAAEQEAVMRAALLGVAPRDTAALIATPRRSSV